MKFKPLEWEIIKHRLGASDAIAESLTDHCEGEQPASNFSYDEIENAADELQINGPKISITVLELEIIREACEQPFRKVRTYFIRAIEQGINKRSRVRPRSGTRIKILFRGSY